MKISPKILKRNQELAQKRFDNNIKLLAILVDLFNKHRDIRFMQAMQSLGFVAQDEYVVGDTNWINNYYEEPEVTFERVKKIADQVLYGD